MATFERLSSSSKQAPSTRIGGTTDYRTSMLGTRSKSPMLDPMNRKGTSLGSRAPMQGLRSTPRGGSSTATTPAAGEQRRKLRSSFDPDKARELATQAKYISSQRGMTRAQRAAQQNLLRRTYELDAAGASDEVKSAVLATAQEAAFGKGLTRSQRTGLSDTANFLFDDAIQTDATKTKTLEESLMEELGIDYEDML